MGDSYLYIIHFYYGDNNKMYIVILDEADSGKEFADITQYNLVVEQKLWEIVHQTLYDRYNLENTLQESTHKNITLL